MTKAANTRTQGLQWGILLATQSERKETELLAFRCEQTGEQQVYFHPKVILQGLRVLCGQCSGLTESQDCNVI